MLSVKRFIYVTAVLFFSTSTVAITINSYDTDLLGKMAEAMNVTQELDTLGDGFYYRNYAYNGRPLTIEVQRGNIKHIGYSLFSKTQRKSLNSPVCNFLERYSLEITLPLQRQKSVSRQLEEDGIFFRHGSFDAFRQIEQDTSYTVKIENLNDKRYTVSWIKRGKEFLAVNFPIEYELLVGCNMIENERKLIADVQNTIIENQSKATLDCTDAFQPSWQGKYYVLKGNTCYIPQLNSNKYYVKNEKRNSVSYQLLYDSHFMVESLANLFTTADIPNNFTVELRIKKYGLKEDIIIVPLNQWTVFCLNQGCIPYFGVAKNEKNVTCEIVMHNKAMGYAHIVRAVIDSEGMEERNSTIMARVLPYVPTTRIKYLFDELKM